MEKVVEIDKGKAGMKCQRSFGHLSGQCRMSFVKKKSETVEKNGNWDTTGGHFRTPMTTMMASTLVPVIL